MPVESFRKHPAFSRSRGTSETAIRSPKNLPCLKKPWSPVSGLEKFSDDPLASFPLRRACQSPSARPNVPPGLRFSHECFNAPKSLSTPYGSTFDPASFACVESPSGLRGTLPITRLTLPIQRSQRTGVQIYANLRRASYTSFCSPFGSTEPLLWTPARFESEFPNSQT
jgi:hypothetical protein